MTGVRLGKSKECFIWAGGVQGNLIYSGIFFQLCMALLSVLYWAAFGRAQ